MSMQNKWYANQNYTNQPLVSIDVPHRKAVWLKTFLLIFPVQTLSNLMNQWCIYRLCNMCTLVHRAFEILLHFQHLQSDHQVLLNFFGECKFVTPICLTRPRCGCTLLPKENGRYFRLLFFQMYCLEEIVCIVIQIEPFCFNILKINISPRWLP